MSNQYKLRYIIAILFAVVTLLIVGIQLVGVVFAQQIPTSFIVTLSYFAFLSLVMVIYCLIRNKLRKMKMKSRKKRYIKYAYIALVILVTRAVALFLFGNFNINNEIFESFTGEVTQINIYKQVILCIYNLFNIFIPYSVISNAIVNVIITTIIALLIRIIISKTTKSPLTADIATIAFVAYPKLILMTTVINYEIFNLCLMLIVINLMFNVIKLCKEMGYSKYMHIVYSGIIGCIVGIDLLIGGNALIWTLFYIITLLIIKDVEVTHLKFPENIVNKLKENVKEFVYKLQRININKLFVCMIVIFLTTCISSCIYFMVFSKIKGNNMFGYKSYATNFSFGSTNIALNIGKSNLNEQEKFEVSSYIRKEVKEQDSKEYKKNTKRNINEAIKQYTNRSFIDNAGFSYYKLSKLLKNDINMDTQFIYNLNNQSIVYNIAGTSNFINNIIYILLVITELANLCLARKKDLFTTVIKIAFLCNFVYIVCFASSFYIPVYLQIFSIILVILNIGNIYFNREDRIKMIGDQFEKMT